MAKKISGWNITCERFVAFLDIMGFRDMVLRREHKEVLKVIKSFQPYIKGIEEDALELLVPKRAELKEDNREKHRISVIRPVSFSDSIILISNENSFVSAIQILIFVSLILKQAIVKGIPMKGAIAYGLQTADFDNSLHFGRPLIDAYELQKDLQLYGAVLHHTVEKYLHDINIIDKYEDLLILKYPVPMRSNKITHYLVDWPYFFKHDENAVNVVSQLYNSVSGATRLYVDNTLKFTQWFYDEKSKIIQKMRESGGIRARKKATPK